jgi:protein phosphatase
MYKFLPVEASAPKKKEKTDLLMTLIKVGFETHQGMKRVENQDYAAYRSLKNTPFSRNGILMVLADGMGGYAGGSIASKIAVNTLIDEFYPKRQSDIINSLKKSFIKANNLILTHSRKDPNLKGMGTTLTTAVIQNDQLFFAHVGDSRGYIVSETDITQLTEDHTYVADLLKQGLISPHEAQNHPYDHIITRAIGVSTNIVVDHSLTSYKIKSKQAVVLCSDGLYKCIGNKEIYDIIRKYPDPSAACRKLVSRANQEGGPDNITVMIALFDQVNTKPNWFFGLRQ